MSAWITTYDGVFFISIATIVAGILKHAFDKCYDSKCEKFSICWSFIRVKRRVDLENQKEIRALELKNIDPNTQLEVKSAPASEKIERKENDAGPSKSERHV